MLNKDTVHAIVDSEGVEIFPADTRLTEEGIEAILNSDVKEVQVRNNEIHGIEVEAIVEGTGVIEPLKDQTVEGTVSGGMVTAIANGDGKILDIKIKEEVVDPEDIEMLQDMVLTAVNDALEKSTQLKEETLGKFTNGLNIPGL